MGCPLKPTQRLPKSGLLLGFPLKNRPSWFPLSTELWGAFWLPRKNTTGTLPSEKEEAKQETKRKDKRQRKQHKTRSFLKKKEERDNTQKAKNNKALKQQKEEKHERPRSHAWDEPPGWAEHFPAQSFAAAKALQARVTRIYA